MRVVFMGAPEFAVPTLREIANRGHFIAAVYTRAPKPGGRRGLEIRKTKVHQAAEFLGLPVYTPATLATEDVQEGFGNHSPDVGVVVAYGLSLPPAVLTAPRFGCLNLHASLLPRWRGAAPVQRAIMAGDRQTGVDLMRMDEGLDTGPIGLREIVSIQPEDTAGDLTSRLAQIAAQLAVRGLDALQAGKLSFRQQQSIGECYARKVSKSELAIDWTREAEAVRNHIHGLAPSPGAYSKLSFRGTAARVKILRAEVVTAVGAPGVILDDAMTVACGESAVRVLEGQREGGTVLSGRELMRRESVPIGAAFALSRSPTGI